MRKPLAALTGTGVLLVICATLVGCSRTPVALTSAPPLVTVGYPVQREVTDSAEFTGRVAAVESVQVRARVSGYLNKIDFTEGKEVKAGDLLYEIDPRPYQAALAQAEGNLGLFESRFRRQEADVARAQSLYTTNALSREDYDKAVGDRGETIASIRAQKGIIDRAKLDLGFTKITAPVAGRVSRTQITLGNLVKADDTLLTSLVSLDPIYVYFDVDEGTVLRVQELIRAGKAKSAREGGMKVSLRLANGKLYPDAGTVDFVDNQVDPKTGTLRLRGVFTNEKRVLTPGLFGRVRVPIGDPHQALLVADRVGALHDGLRVIESGLQPSERVIIDGLQQVKPGTIVQPKLIDMATVTGPREKP
jgi:RND family efflux transporter MFP subunit